MRAGEAPQAPGVGAALKKFAGETRREIERDEHMKKSMFIVALAGAAGIAVAAPASFVDLGVIGAPGSYTFNTDGSFNTAFGFDADTELGLWDSAGVLIDEDDDGSAVGLFSEITVNLAPGEYFLGISEFNSDFEDGFLNVTDPLEVDDVIDVVLNINGVFAGSQLIEDLGVDGTAETGFFRVEVIPTPGAAGLLGLAGLAAVRRRR